MLCLQEGAAMHRDSPKSIQWEKKITNQGTIIIIINDQQFV
jgi:hypothetical protein